MNGKIGGEWKGKERKNVERKREEWDDAKEKKGSRKEMALIHAESVYEFRKQIKTIDKKYNMKVGDYMRYIISFILSLLGR